MSICEKAGLRLTLLLIVLNGIEMAKGTKWTYDQKAFNRTKWN